MKRTVSGGAVVVNRGRVAVVRQRGDVWSLPKGHVKPKLGEGTLEAAVREVREETGLRRLTLVRELGTYERYRIGLTEPEDRTEMKEMTFYLFATDQEDLGPEDPKILEARWMDPEEVGPLLTHPKDREFFESLLPLP